MQKASRLLISIMVTIAYVLIPINSSHAAAACTPTVTRSGNYKYLTFTNTSVCTWTVPSGMTIASTILLVGGGGGSGYYGNAGGGGAGALVVTTNFPLTPGATYDITAGSAGTAPATGKGRGNTGGNTIFGSITAAGGGYGAGGDGTNGVATNNGGDGGSGGGGSSYTNNLTNPGGSSTASTGISSPWTAYGNAGAAGSGGGVGGGGGGAGGAASNGTGGNGRTYFGTVYAKGGSSSQGSNQNTAGTGNGGNTITNGGDGATGSVVIEVPRPVFSYATTSPTTVTGTAFANNPITASGLAIASYSISPALPTDLSINTSSGQIVGTPSALLSSTSYTITATDVTGETGTATLTLAITAGTATLTFSNIASSIYKGVTLNLVATSPGPGKVRFYANGKRIPNCLSITTTQVSPYTATCPWKPTTQGPIKLTATFTSTNGAFISGSATPVTLNIFKRTNSR